MVPTAPSREARACAGFEENLVLAVKDCFLEWELRELLIVEGGAGVQYHSRACGGQVPGGQVPGGRRVCPPCDHWFLGLTAAKEVEEDAWPPDPPPCKLKKVEGKLVCKVDGCNKVFQKKKNWVKHRSMHKRKKEDDWIEEELRELEEEEESNFGEGSQERRRRYSEDR